MSNKGELAKNLFECPNTNCAQAVLCAFREETGMDDKTAMKIAIGFAGGLKDLEACGAVTGAIMALGLAKGQTGEDNTTANQKASDLTIEFNNLFKEKYGSIVCRDLKDKDICAKLVYDGAAILQKLLST